MTTHPVATIVEDRDPRPTWVELRDPTSGALVLRYDPTRRLVEGMVNRFSRELGRREKYRVIFDLSTVPGAEPPAE